MAQWNCVEMRKLLEIKSAGYELGMCMTPSMGNESAHSKTVLRVNRINQNVPGTTQPLLSRAPVFLRVVRLDCGELSLLQRAAKMRRGKTDQFSPSTGLNK